MSVLRSCVAVSLAALSTVAAAQSIEALQIGPWRVGPDDVRRVQAVVECHTGQTVVNMAFSPEGTRQLADLTSKHIGKTLAVRLGEEILVKPTVRAPIEQGYLQISGGLSNQLDGEALAARLQAALRLPQIPLRPCDAPGR